MLLLLVPLLAVLLVLLAIMLVLLAILLVLMLLLLGGGGVMDGNAWSFDSADAHVAYTELATALSDHMLQALNDDVM